MSGYKDGCTYIVRVEILHLPLQVVEVNRSILSGHNGHTLCTVLEVVVEEARDFIPQNLLTRSIVPWRAPQVSPRR